jgi:hypothetical protein
MEAIPCKVEVVLTGNGIRFTDPGAGLGGDRTSPGCQALDEQ